MIMNIIMLNITAQTALIVEIANSLTLSKEKLNSYDEIIICSTNSLEEQKHDIRQHGYKIFTLTNE